MRVYYTYINKRLKKKHRFSNVSIFKTGKKELKQCGVMRVQPRTCLKGCQHCSLNQTDKRQRIVNAKRETYEGRQRAERYQLWKHTHAHLGSKEPFTNQVQTPMKKNLESSLRRSRWKS